MPRNSFIVDLTDPRDIRAKLAEGEDILKEIDKQLAGFDALQREAREWRANVEFLASKLPSDEQVDENDRPQTDIVAQTTGGTVAVEAKAHRGERTLDCVVEVVNREVRKIRAIEVHAILEREGRDFTPDQVRNTLHYAAHKAQHPLIQAAPGRGMYAPLAYREVEQAGPTGDTAGQAPEPLAGRIAEAPRAPVIWRTGGLQQIRG